jgi:hypothetical protein
VNSFAQSHLIQCEDVCLVLIFACVHACMCVYAFVTWSFLFLHRFTGPLQNRSLDHNISKRSRSPTLSYQDVDGTEARIDTSGNSRRYINMLIFLRD